MMLASSLFIVRIEGMDTLLRQIERPFFKGMLLLKNANFADNEWPLKRYLTH